MEVFQYEILAWIKLSKDEEKLASSWYRGVGWYMNSQDESATVTCALVSPSQTDHAAGALGALNACGKEGWEVLAFVPNEPSPASFSGEVAGNLMKWVSGFDASSGGAYFLLKRRIST